MIQWIRRCLCKHEFEEVKQNEYPDKTITSYICKNCGWIRRVKIK